MRARGAVFRVTRAVVLGLPGMDKFAAMSAFVSVAEARSFTVAARRLNMTSSAVGKAIQRLEEQLGVPLLNRSTRTVSLTPEGALFLDHCGQILAAVHAAESDMAERSSTPRGSLRVSIPVAISLLSGPLAEFSRLYPAIELELAFSDLPVDLIEGGFDVMLRFGEVEDSTLMTKLVGRFHYVTVASPTYLAARGAPQHPDDLVDHVCLRHRRSLSGKLDPWRFRKASASDPAIPASVISNTLAPLIGMAENGAGLVHVPEFAVDRQLRSGQLTKVLAAHLADPEPLRILWPSSRHALPKVRTFIEFMTEQLAARIGR
jgi:DNA-binding transcriptional LysR family regulator